MEIQKLEGLSIASPDLLPQQEEAPQGRDLVAEIGAQGAAQAKKIMLESVDRQVEKAEESQAETEKPERGEKTDNAELSRQSRLYGLSPEQIEKLVKFWTLEMEAELWEKLLNWMPGSAGSLTAELKGLAALYQKLLEAVLRHTDGAAQAVQLRRLDQALSVACNKLLEAELGELERFLEQFGSGEDRFTVKASIHQMASGHALPPERMEKFWQGDRGSGSASPGQSAGGTGNGQKAAAEAGGPRLLLAGGTAGAAASAGAGLPREPQIERGTLLYRPGEQGRVAVDQRFQSHVAESEIRMERTPARALASEDQRTGFQGGKSPVSALKARMYTGEDLERSESFVRHVAGKGNLFGNSAIDGRSEELVGFLGAEMAIKARIFSELPGVGVPMKVTVRNAVDRMVDYYLSQAFEGQRVPAGSRERDTVPYNRSAVYKVYYNMMELYQREKTPQKAVSGGLLHALELFRQRKEETALRQSLRYRTEAGFFHEIPAKLRGESAGTVETEWQEGKRLLEQDWKEFLKSLGKRGKKLPLELLEQSPWGLGVKPSVLPEQTVNKKEKRTAFWIFFALFTIAVLVLLCLARL